MKYLNNSSLENICKQGDDKEIKKYLTFYEQKRSEMTDSLDLIVSGAQKIDEQAFNDLTQIIEDKNIDIEAKNILVDTMTDNKGLGVLLKNYNKITNRLGWYDKVIRDLNDAL